MSDFIIANARLFDGETPELSDANILVRGDRITEVSDRPVSAAGARVIDLKGKVLMPGLIDAHVHCYCPHVDIAAGDRLPLSAVAHRARGMLDGVLMRGFTTVRDTGGGDQGLALALERGWITGPRLFYCGKAFSQTGGHGDLRGAAPMCSCGAGYQGHLSCVVDGPDQLRLAVREELRKGAHFIKILASGGVSSPNDSLHGAQYSDDEICAVVDEVTRHGTYVTAHVHPDAALKRCIELGVQCIEHGTLISEATAALAARTKTPVVPTLAVVGALKQHGRALGFPEVSMAKLAEIEPLALTAVARLHRAGARIGFGTDLIGELHPHQCLEFALRREVLAPVDILRSATSVNAAIIGQGDSLGRVAPGYLADLIVVDGDPLRDLGVFTEDGRNVPIIIKDGQFMKNSDV